MNPHEREGLRLPFASEAALELILTTLVVFGLWTAWSIWASGILLTLAIVVTLVWLALLFFMRDPQRISPPEQEVYLAPADGKVMAIDHVNEESFVGGSALRIAIFLSLLDVHVNRSPAAGEIRKVRHVPGRFLQAFRPEASQVNEYNDIGLEEPAGRILVKQIAGILARRIVCSVREGDQVRAGQRLGMIKFGSRTEVFLPPDCRVAVGLGDKVRGGLTILARQRG